MRRWEQAPRNAAASVTPSSVSALLLAPVQAPASPARSRTFRPRRRSRASVSVRLHDDAGRRSGARHRAGRRHRSRRARQRHVADLPGADARRAAAEPGGHRRCSTTWASIRSRAIVRSRAVHGLRHGRASSASCLPRTPQAATAAALRVAAASSPTRCWRGCSSASAWRSAAAASRAAVARRRLEALIRHVALAAVVILIAWLYVRSNRARRPAEPDAGSADRRRAGSHRPGGGDVAVAACRRRCRSAACNSSSPPSWQRRILIDWGFIGGSERPAGDAVRAAQSSGLNR